MDSTPSPAASSAASPTSKLFNNLDYKEEHACIQDAGLLKELDASLKQIFPQKAGARFDSIEDVLALPAPPSNYTGPKLKHPLTAMDVHNMVGALKRGQFLHKKFALQLLVGLRDYYKTQPNLTRITVKESDKLTVVGDLHGQLDDLLVIFRKIGFPSATNKFLFNGDFVDRGSNSVEIVLILAAFKVLYPDCVHMNRGNHETRTLNYNYGFEDEVMDKYDADTFEVFQGAFMTIPLAATINRSIFVVHGGLPRNPTAPLDDLMDFNRFQDDPEDGYLMDFMWSDPQDDKGLAESDRGAGVLFGPDVTERFCASNKFNFIMRSHEMVDEGYEISHNRKCVTVFSASNYSKSVHNNGAVISFNHKLQPQIVQYFASGAKSKSESETKQVNLEKIQELIIKNRSRLLQCFREADVGKTGRLSVGDWASGMCAAVAPDIPWAALQPDLVELTSDDLIDYRAFLNQFVVHVADDMDALQHSIVTKVLDRIYTQRMSLGDAFSKFDTNGDGTLSYDEFVQALTAFDLGLTPDQLRSLAEGVDANKDGTIDFREFLDRFQVSYNPQDIPPEVDNVDVYQTAIRRLGDHFLSMGWSMEEAFRKFDLDSDGQVTHDEFTKSIKSLKIDLGVGVEALLKFIDGNENKVIDYVEFSRAFAVVDTQQAHSDWETDVVRHVTDSLFKCRLGMKRAFRFFDRDGSGVITADEFVTGMRALNQVLDSPLSELEIQALLNILDANDDKMVDYSEFCRTFKIKTNK